MAESTEDRTKRVSEEAEKLYADAGEEQRSTAEGARSDEEAAPETDEEYYERIRTVPGIFGDTDTTGGSDAGIDTPSNQNELATVAVAKSDAKKEKGEDSDEANASHAEARSAVSTRQADVHAAEKAGNVVEGSDDDKSDDKSVAKSGRRSANK